MFKHALAVVILAASLVPATAQQLPSAGLQQQCFAQCAAKTQQEMAGVMARTGAPISGIDPADSEPIYHEQEICREQCQCRYPTPGSARACQ